MKKLLPLFCFAYFYASTSTASSNAVRLLSSDNTTSILEFVPGSFSFKTVATPNGEAKIISLTDGIPLLELGAPDLQKLTASLIIPDKGEMKVDIISSDFYDLNNINIAPSKGNLMRNVNPLDVSYTYGNIYSQNAFFPANISALGKPYILRDYRGQTVSVCPFQYNPQTKVLRVYTKIVVSVNVKNSIGGENLFDRTTSEMIIDQEFESIYKKQFINYSNQPTLRYTPVSENGSMLVICYNSFATDMQPFVTWKNKKGIATEMVLKSVAGSTNTAIKNYIANYYTTHPALKYVLLVGDAAQIPSSTTMAGDSDNNYGYLLGNDSYSEVFVGRFSATTSTEVQTMVNRTIRYEQFPTLGGTWYKKGITIGSSQGPGDDGEMDFEHQRNLRAQMLGFTYNNVTENYDGSQGGLDASGNPTPTMIGNQINNGVGIITYTGHGSSSAFVSSNYSSSHIPSLTNTTMHPFIWSVACVNGDFVNNGACFAETWLRAGTPSQPKGALATFMSTINQSWNPPMEGQDEMVNILVESAGGNIKRSFGGLSMNGCMQMNDAYGSAGDDMTDTWTCFGDPSVMVYTNSPANMTVTHVSSIAVGTISVTVNCNVNNALICLSKNGVILGKGIATGGSAIITIPAATAGTIDVVATAFNKMPYFGTITVGSTGISEFDNTLLNVFPNPANNLLYISYLNSGENQKINIYNQLGQLVLPVTNETSSNNTAYKQINVESLPAGVYFIRVEDETSASGKYFVIQR